MAGGGRVLAVLGAIVVAAVAAGVWLVTSEPSPDAAEPAPESPATGPGEVRPDRDPVRKPTTRRKAKDAGTAEVFGVVKRRETSAGAAGQTVALVREGQEPWTATADESGTFRLAELPDGGPFELRVEAKGCGTIRLPGIVLGRGEKRDVGTLWLDRSVKVVVAVRTMADEPVEGAEVEAHAAPDQSRGNPDWSKVWAQAAAEPVPVAKATTGKDGRVEFPEMAAGVWTFAARKQGLGRDGRSNVRLSGSENPPEVKIFLATGHALRGRVLDGEKKPVAGALVLGGRPGNPWDMGSSPLRARAKADAEGKWELRDLPSGDVALLVGRTGSLPFQAAVVRVPNVTTYDLYIRDGGRIEGVVTDVATGKPVEGATVRAQSWGTVQRLAEATTDAEGKYAIDPVPDGPINDVSVQKDGWIHDRSEDPPYGRQIQVQPGEVAKRDVRMRKGAAVRGVVTGPEGPVQGARVTVYTSSRDGNVGQSPPVFTDAEGKFVVTSSDAGTGLVQASREGFVQKGFPENWWQAVQQGNVPPQHRVEVPETGEVVANVRLERGQRVEGRIETPEGPLGGVAITAYGGTGTVANAKSRDDGTFVLEGIAATQRLNLNAQKEGWLQSRGEPLAVSADEPLTNAVVKMVRQGRITGKVVAATGDPLRDAQVVVVMRRASPQAPGVPLEIPMMQTGGASGPPVPVRADGSFEVPVPWAEGTVAVRATALDLAPGESAPVTLVAGTSEYTANVVLESGYSIRGRVSAAGAAVTGADVTLGSRGRGRNEMVEDSWEIEGLSGRVAPSSGGGGGGVVVAVTDAEGTFVIDHVTAGSYSVGARAEGYVAKGAPEVKVPTSGDVSIELEAALEITGRLAFADSKAVAGATVVAQKDAPGRVNRFGGWSGGGASSVTGPDGNFRIRGLAPGAYRLNVQSPWDGSVNFKPLQSDPVTAGSTDVKLFVETGGVISGKVVDPGKRPVAGAQINANPSKQDGGNQWRYARTKSDGTFEIAGLGDAPYHLFASPPAGALGAALRPVGAQNVAVGTRNLELVLEEGLTIEGRIVDSAGKPVSEAQLYVQAKPNAQGQMPTVNGNNMWSATDPDGRFRFVGLGPGNYRVILQQWQGGRYGSLLLEGADDLAAGSTDVKLVASEGEKIAGVVVDEAGQPLSGAWINAWSQSGTVQRSARTDKDGKFEISGLPRGTVRLNAGAANRPQVNLENVETGSTVLRVVIPRGGSITGRILDSGGAPFGNQGIQLRQTEGGSHNGWAQTDANGNFNAQALLEGTYEITSWRRKSDGSAMEQVKLGTAKTGENVELRIP